MNAIVFPLLVSPFLFGNNVVASLLDGARGPILGTAAPGAASAGIGAKVAYAILFFIASDSGRFVAHSLLHDVRLLWEFHKVHHSLNHWLISPVHHQIHHSSEARHWGCNRGFGLALPSPKLKRDTIRVCIYFGFVLTAGDQDRMDGIYRINKITELRSAPSATIENGKDLHDS